MAGILSSPSSDPRAPSSLDSCGSPIWACWSWPSPGARRFPSSPSCSNTGTPISWRRRAMSWLCPSSCCCCACWNRGNSTFAACSACRVWILGTALGLFVPLYTLGVAHADPNTAAIIGSMGPVIAGLVAWIGFALPIERTIWPAIVLAFAGGVLATYRPDRQRIRPPRRRIPHHPRGAVLELVLPGGAALAGPLVAAEDQRHHHGAGGFGFGGGVCRCRLCSAGRLGRYRRPAIHWMSACCSG